MKILVTGGAGFIGSHLVDKLISLNHEVVILDNFMGGFNENVNSKAIFNKIDIRNFDDVKKTISGIEVIYHAAASATTKESSLGWTNPFYDLEVNTFGTLNILQSIVEIDKKIKLIYISSAAVYGPPEYVPIDERHITSPISPYGISKLASEKYVQAFSKQHSLDSVIVRIFNVYGPRQPRYLMFDLITRLTNNPEILKIYGTGKQIRDFCYISDAVDGLLLFLEDHYSADIFNLTSGVSNRVYEIVNMIIKIMKLKNKTKLIFTGESWPGDIEVLHGDNKKIIDILGFNPKIGICEGLNALYDWYIDKYLDRK